MINPCIMAEPCRQTNDILHSKKPPFIKKVVSKHLFIHSFHSAVDVANVS